MALEHVTALNEGLAHDCILALISMLITVYYYKEKNATFIVAFFITIHYMLGIVLMPIKFYYKFGYDWQYLMSSTIASYVIIRLIIEIHLYNLKITIVESGIVILQTFIVVCMGCRFFEKLLFSHTSTSEIYEVINYFAYYLIIAVLLIPILRKILRSIKISPYLQYIKKYTTEKSSINITKENIH